MGGIEIWQRSERGERQTFWAGGKSWVKVRGEIDLEKTMARVAKGECSPRGQWEIGWGQMEEMGSR